MPKPVWPGATSEHTPRGSATGEQQRQTVLGAQTLRATSLLPLGFVAAIVTTRYVDAPKVSPQHFKCRMIVSVSATPSGEAVWM